MAEITIADATPRVQYTIGGTGSTGPFTIPWPYFSVSDIKVYFDNTLKTISTHYTIAGTAVDDGFSGGAITLADSQTNITVTVVRDIPIERTTDFPVGPFNVKTLNKDLDKLYAIAQQAEENFSRKVGRSATDTTTFSLDLPASTGTAKTLMLDSSNGLTLGVSTATITDASAQATAAANSATASANSATSSASSATASASSATSAAATAVTLSGASSTTSIAIGTGSKAFTVSAGLAFVAGDWVLITSNANPSVNYMHGPIASYSSTTMTVTVDNVGGSGTLSDWTIRRSGVQGATGATGSTGPTGATGSASSDPELSAIAGLTSAAGKMIEFTGSGSAQVIDVTTAGKALMDDADASAQRTTMGVAIGSDVQAFDADILKADTADNLTAGFSTTVHDAGTKSSGTYTPDQDDGNIQKAVNGGAHTLAPTVDDCAMIIQYTNNASAGTITTSGFTKVDGDTITTTNGDDFFFYLTKANGFSLLTVKALQ